MKFKKLIIFLLILVNIIYIGHGYTMEEHADVLDLEDLDVRLIFKLVARVIYNEKARGNNYHCSKLEHNHK